MNYKEAHNLVNNLSEEDELFLLKILVEKRICRLREKQGSESMTSRTDRLAKAEEVLRKAFRMK